jgi:pyruvate,water dikinase
MAKKWIYWFEELGAEHNELVGKKCANLGEMTRLSMRVPTGFAISVDGYEQFMEESGAGAEVKRYIINNRDALGTVDKQVEASHIIREFIESKEMPGRMKEELSANYSLLCKRTGLENVSVAVRSSGSVSMPGQMETFLNVEGAEDLTRKVIQVWGSAFTTRAIAFRLEKGMDMEKAPIGVAVLKMINAKCAGVCLTVLPTTGDTSKVVVEGNWGLGESVVSGEITPDQFIVDKSTEEYELTVGQKTKMVIYNSKGTCLIDVPEEMCGKPCLEESELQEIVRIAKNVEAHFDTPQDTEWVYDQDLAFPENLFWVQTRPAKYTAKQENSSEYLAELMSRMFKT